MSILDVDNLVEDNTMIIKQWLDKNCEFIGCYPEIHNNIVDVKIDPEYSFRPILKIETNDINIPTDIFRFGECESMYYKNGKIKPLINLSIMNCNKLIDFEGLPNNLHRLFIFRCKSLKSIKGLPSIIKILDVSNCRYNNMQLTNKLVRLNYKVCWS